jgi:large subunit ribosomal protein L25
VSTRQTLSAHRREVTGKAVAHLRREGLLPAVVYGHDHPSESIQVDAKEFEHIRRSAGRHALIDLKIGTGRPRPVLIQTVQEHPVRRVPLHIDFHAVRMTEEMTADIPLLSTGQSVMVERYDGTLLQTLDHLRVHALPADLPQEVRFDISRLDSFEAVLHVRDLPLPPRVTVLNDMDEPVAHVQQPRVEVVAPVAGAEAGILPAAGEGAAAT